MKEVITADDLRKIAKNLNDTADSAESNSSGRGSRESEAGSMRAETLRDVAQCLIEFIEES